MSLRFLFGPDRQLPQRLPQATREGQAIAFSADQLWRASSWEAFAQSLALEGMPDFLVFDLPYRVVPPWLWSAPLPLVALAGDAPLQWHAYRRLECCDLLLADAPSVERFHRQGLAHARPANLYGVEQVFLDEGTGEDERDIDLLFVGNLHPHLQGERLAWLQRLARFRDRFHVQILTDAWGADYRALLRRAKIIFNRSARSEWNRRVSETLAGGALALIERGNAEVTGVLRDRVECIFYEDNDLESLLEHYLSHEEERAAIAAAGHVRAGEFSFEAQFQQALDFIGENLVGLRERARLRLLSGAKPDLVTRTWLAVSGSFGDDSALASELRQSLERAPHDANLHNALGIAHALQARQGGQVTAESARQAAEHFRQALVRDCRHLVAALNLAEAFCGLGLGDAAAEAARRSLLALEHDEGGAPAWLDAPHFPPGFDRFTVEWHRAAWDHPADPAGEARAKRTLLRWRLHTLLASLTDEPAHYHEAVSARPDLPTARAALGCALGRAGKPELAVAHLRQAVEANPFDTEAVAALHVALAQCDDQVGLAKLARDQGLLAAAAPDIVAVQPWFLRPVDASRLNLQVLAREEFTRKYGQPDTSRALSGFTPPEDTHVVLTLLAHTQAKRILEIGTAEGHMSANLTEWSPDDATVFTLGITDDMAGASRPEQHYEAPPRQVLGRLAGHFGKADKVFQVTADSLHYDFQRLAPLDFAFIDGAHDREHVLSDTRKVYEALRPGGCLVWHDFGSNTSWVEVKEALEEADLPEPIQHVTGTQVAFLFKQEQATPHERNGQVEAVNEQPAVVWEGGIASVSSLALVNRELCSRLLTGTIELSVVPTEFHPALGVPELPLPAALTRCFRRKLSRRADVHVRHYWPPRLRPPAEGRWVLMQPWEFGSIPRLWAEVIVPQVDEVWVPTSYVRDCFVEGGVPAERVAVIPLGVDPARFHPDVSSLPLQTGKGFRFLFVGGTLPRKGIDVLLEAYGKAFSAKDDVCLVIKDMGNGSFYHGQTAEHLLHAFRDKPDAPAIEYLDRSLSSEELAGLYRACDCLVHPYRGEGFGLPIAEAMACGLPVIVTGMGAALDFCSEDTAYLIPARRVDFAERSVSGLETVGTPWLAEPDAGALVELLRQVVNHPDEARTKGARASAHIRGHFTWDRSAATIEERLRELRSRPIIRFQHRARTFVPAPRRMRVSLCMIVKNEEGNLPRCLHSVLDLVDEVILVDTGSTDRTKDIAASFGSKVKVFDFAWVDSFAVARNESIRHATGDFIFWMDGDDYLDAPNRQALQELLAGLRDENAAWTMKCYCPADRAGNHPTMVDHIRLFRRRPEHTWTYRVHEQILPALRQTGAEVRRSNVVIGHTGYLDPGLRARKQIQRDLPLLRMEAEEKPEEPFVLFNLGSTMQELGRHEEALTYLKRSLELSDPGASITRKLYALIAGCLNALGRPTEAVEVCRQGRTVCPGDAELLFREGQLLAEMGSLPLAEACFRELLFGRPEPAFASVDPHLRGWRGRHELAKVLYRQGRHPEAWQEWVAVTKENPGCLAAWLGLADTAQAAGQGEAVEDIARRLEALPAGKLEAELVRGRWLLTRRQTLQALQLATRLIEAHPQAEGPRELLGWALEQTGKDRDAEQAWRELLRLDPCHGEANTRLAHLLRQRCRNEDAYFEAQEQLTGWLLHEQYQAACLTPSDLQEHLPVLHDLARECRHITELGLGDGMAALAFLWAQPEKLVCLDLVASPLVPRLQALAGRTQLVFRRADATQAELDETDLLLVPPLPTESLRQALARHVGKVRHLLVVQGTGNGAWTVVEELLGEGTFRLKERHENRQGLAVLERIVPDRPCIVEGGMAS